MSHLQILQVLNLVDQKGVNFDHKRLLKDISNHNFDYNEYRCREI